MYTATNEFYSVVRFWIRSVLTGTRRDEQRALQCVVTLR